MPAYKKGNFVIKNAEGLVTLAGDATSIFNDSNNSVNYSESNPIDMHMDSGGIPRTLTKNYVEYTLELELTPGVGGTTGAANFASLAALKTAFVLPPRGSQIITSGFDVAGLNWDTSTKAIVWDASIQQSAEGLSTIRCTAKKFADNAGTVIDFTGAWTAS
jgi:hypothetical protein